MVQPTLTKEQRDTSLNDAPTVAPTMDADIKHGDSASRLEHLRVSDDELVGKLKYEQLSLYEKKSCVLFLRRRRPALEQLAHPLVRPLQRSRASYDLVRAHMSCEADVLARLQINRELDLMVRPFFSLRRRRSGPQALWGERADLPLPRLQNKASFWGMGRYQVRRARPARLRG